MKHFYLRALAVFALVLNFALDAVSQNAALNFDGTSDVVQTNYTGISGTNPRTVEAWIKLTANSDPGLGGIQHVITDWGSATTGGRFTFNVLWGNAIRIEVQGNGLSGTIPVNDGQWHHVAVTYSPSATNKYSLYVDGVLDISGNLTVAQNTTTTINMRIGQRVDGINYFAGSIDEVRVFNYARTITEINASKNKEFCVLPTGLVAYYKLNEGTPNAVNTANTIATDYTSGGHNGTLNSFSLAGTASNWVTGPALTGGSTFASTTVNTCNAYTAPSGHIYTQSGVFQDTIANASGCDSIITVNLTVGSSNTTSYMTVCDSYTWGATGMTYTASGMYSVTTSNGSGCISTVTLNLTVNQSSNTTQNVTVCNNYTWSTNNVTYTNSGTYTTTFTNTSGCTSTATLNLTITHSTMSNHVAFACNSYTWAANGMTYTTTGGYIAHLTNAQGCDSLLILDLVINHPTTGTQTASACNSYTWAANATTYTVSGNYTTTLTNSMGCDSILTLHLTINTPTSGTQNTTACSSYTWAATGMTYTNSGNYVATLTNSHGCDSIATLHLTISPIITTSQNLSVCNSYTWAVNGMTYTNSGTYTTTLTGVGACDTIATLNLIVNHPNTGSQTTSACGSYAWAASGMSYTNSGTYTATLTNSVGCDSVATLNLTIHNITSSSQTVTACSSYTWAANGMTYTNSGNYTAALTSAFGCDSILTLQLTINNATASISNNSPVLTANSGSSYQWIDCDNGNAPIAGATAQSYTATANGNYAVIVTQNGCTATSACTAVTNVDTHEQNADLNQTVVFPNPTDGVLSVNIPASKIGTEYTVFDQLGRTVANGVLNSSTNTVELSKLPSGVYVLSLGEVKELFKVVKY